MDPRIILIIALIGGCCSYCFGVSLRWNRIRQDEAENAKEVSKLVPQEKEEEPEPTMLYVWYEGDTTAREYGPVDDWETDGKWLCIFTGGDEDHRDYIDTKNPKFLRFTVRNN